jgi:alpha-galactosidase
MHPRLAAFLALLVARAECAEDGVGVLPLMGWRDWNQYGGDISQDIMISTMNAMVAPFPGTNVSLASVGFRDVGLDDVWQLCGSYGPANYTYHDVDGNPVVNTARFPNMSALPATAHALGLTAGF